MTILHGTCLVNGQHPAGSKLARECPVLNAPARSERARRAASTRRERASGGPGASVATSAMGQGGSGAPGPSSLPGAEPQA